MESRMTSSLTRRGYGMVSVYSPDQMLSRIDLSDNTNAWGMPPAARDAVTAAATSARYPSPYADDLKAALASYVQLPERMITTGCGSDDVLDSAIRALAEPGDQLAYTEPTFMMVPTFARLNGLIPVAAELEDLAATGARILYVCSPNNPTGQLVSRKQIEAVLGSCKAGQIVIVDEAYAEFAGTSVVDLARDSAQVFVTRTFSKAFGLAGLRVGYGIGHPALVAEVEKSRGPYKVSGISERAAIAALTEGRSWVMDHAAIAVRMRGQLIEAFRNRDLEPIESSANFVFIPIARATAIARGMRSRGVAVRAFEQPSGVRITVAPWPVLAEALDAFDSARAECD
jgi:histidinol-phosphate aminotransferase